MFELITVIVFLWLLLKAVKLALKLTWGMAKIIASILIGLALPVLVVCLFFAGSILLLVPVVMIGIAILILKACF